MENKKFSKYLKYPQFGLAQVHNVKYSEQIIKDEYQEDNNAKSTKKRAIIAISTIMINIILLTTLALVFGLTFGLPKSTESEAKIRSVYRGNCSIDDDCLLNSNLMCLNYSCECMTDTYYNDTGCAFQQGYNETCNSTKECLMRLNYECTNSSKCDCKNGYYYSSSKSCEVVGSYFSNCTGNNSCDLSKMLYCNNNSSKCVCPNLNYFSTNTSICTSQKVINSSCATTIECRTDLGLSCSSANICDCQSSDYWSISTKSCLAKQVNGTSCTSTIQCQDYNLLSCTSGLCICPSAYYWNSSTCVTKKTYGRSCSASYECDDSDGLVCPTTTGICNCPLNSSTIFCDCPNGNFFDSSANICSPLLTKDQSCTMNYQCNALLGLTCQGSRCLCPPVAGWFWSSTGNKCVQCPSGWTIYSEHCYKVFSTPLSWNNALASCQTYGATLMIVRNQGEYDLLKSFYGSLGTAPNIWVGATSPTVFDFRWVYDNSQLSETSSFWCKDEPNNSGGSSTTVAEGCAFMWEITTATGTSLCFNDYPCSSVELYCCEKVN